MFVRACSGWSLGCGLVRPDELFAWTEQFGVPAVCVADFDNLYGTIEFYEAARQRGVRPVVGAVVTEGARSEERGARNGGGRDKEKGKRGETDEDREPRIGSRGQGIGTPPSNGAWGWHPVSQTLPRGKAIPEDESDTEILIGKTKLVVRQLRGPQLVALACEQVGYENLCKLITARHIAGHFNLVEAAQRHQQGLVYLVQDPELLRQMAGRIEPGHLFAEICDYGDEPSRAHNYRLMRAAAELGIEPVGSHVAYFARKQDWLVHRVLRAVALNKLADRVGPDELVSRGAYLVPAEQIRQRLRSYDRALYNADKLLERCNLQMELGVPHFPKVPLPVGQTACARLCRLVWEGLARRYAKAPSEAMPRLTHELNVITKMGFADYFLVVHEIVQFARSKGIGYVGRGSAADSLVTYCLGISDVDPLRYNLHFERFLNESRTDYPDIDLDFDWRRRDEVIRFVYEHWGSKHVAMICTQHYYKARSAFRDAARVLGMPTEKLNRLTGKLPYDEPDRLREAIATMPECRDFPMHDPQVAKAIAIAEHLAGLPRGLSVHVGGVVISEREITCHTPLQPATKGIAISQYDLRAIERVGLIKIDLLGHRSLAVLADTLQLVQRNRGLSIDLSRLPEDDPDTARILTRGRTVGCFQIESPGVRQLLQMLKAKDLQDIIHALSLIRPGPSASGMKERFIKRKLGLEKVTYLHPAMREALGDTYGVMLYQEDVMRVAAAVAGFTMSTGDSLRKALEKPDSKEHLEGLKKQFMAGALQRGCDERTAEQIWLLVSNFAAYAYNKAHACTYGKISYWCTYMKAHWPAEFLTGVLNNIGGYYSLAEYLEEARRQGVPILGPHVNESELDYTAEPVAVQPVVARRIEQQTRRQGEEETRSNSNDKDEVKRWVACQERGDGHAIQVSGCEIRDLPREPQTTGLTLRRVAIRVRLLEVRNLAEKTARNIVEQRKQRAFVSLEDLLDRVRMSSEESRALVLSGACDGLGESRAAMLWQLAMRRKNRHVSTPTEASTAPGDNALFRDHPHPENCMAANAAAMAPGRGRTPYIAEGSDPVVWGVSQDQGVRPPKDIRGLTPAATGNTPGALPAHLTRDYSKRRLMELERQYLSFSPGDHPLGAWQDVLSGRDIVRSIDLAGCVGRTVTIAGVVVAMRRAVTRSRQLMQFVSLEDRWGLVEVVLFPNIYKQLGGAFQGFGPFLVQGTVQENLGSVVLIGRSVRKVTDSEERVDVSLKHLNTSANTKPAD